MLDVKAKAIAAMIDGVGEEPWGAHHGRRSELPLRPPPPRPLRIVLPAFWQLATLGASAAAEASSVTPRDRLLDAVARHATLPAALDSEIERRCSPADTRCAAHLIVAHLPTARLVRVSHPDTDTIRRAHTVPSVTSVKRRDDGTLVLVLDRFRPHRRSRGRRCHR